MAGAVIGAAAGMLAGAAGFTVLGLTAGSMWLVGAAVGSLFDNRSQMGFNQNSPTYSLGPLQNTKSQLILYQSSMVSVVLVATSSFKTS